MMKTYYVYAAWYRGEDRALLNTTNPCIDPVERPKPCYWMPTHSIDWWNLDLLNLDLLIDYYPILWTNKPTQLWHAKTIDARSYDFSTVELDEDVVNMIVTKYTLSRLAV